MGPFQVTQGWASKGIHFSKWIVSQAFSVTPSQVNTPVFSQTHLLLFFLLCVFCCMCKSNMGVEENVLGQIMQYGWKCFSCTDLA